MNDRRRQRFTRATWVLGALLFTTAELPADDWPQWLGPRRDGVWREEGILARFPAGGPKVLWKQEVGGGFSGPAVAGGRVYVMDRAGDPLKKGQEAPGKAGLAGKERVVCLDAERGHILWKHDYDCAYRIHYPSGPRTTPTVAGGKLYTLGAMGDLLCLDAAKGDVHWRKNLPEHCQTKPPVWGYASHPLVDDRHVYCLAGGEGSAVVAFDNDDGKEVWRALTVKEIGYAPLMIHTIAGKRQLIAWHTEAIAGLDPETGKTLWSHKFPPGEPERPAIAVATPRLENDLLYVSAPHHGSLMLKFNGDRPDVFWQSKSNDLSRPDGLHALMGSPILQGGYVYGVCSFGELRRLDGATGKRLWEHRLTERKALGYTAFFVPQGDRCFLFDEQGQLAIVRLTPKGLEEIDRTQLIEPTLHSRGRDAVWSHPAFAQRRVYARNDKTLLCVDLATP